MFRYRLHLGDENRQIPRNEFSLTLDSTHHPQICCLGFVVVSTEIPGRQHALEHLGKNKRKQHRALYCFKTRRWYPRCKARYLRGPQITFNTLTVYSEAHAKATGIAKMRRHLLCLAQKCKGKKKRNCESCSGRKMGVT